MKIAFGNFPWWEQTDKGLRYGIRAGSRWPFTQLAHCLPGQFTFGGYLPYPFFMGYAASYVAREVPGSEVVLRDSLALRESYTAFMEWIVSWQPDFIVVESATPSWGHDRKVIEVLANVLPGCRIIVTGTITTTKAAEALDTIGVVAVVQGEYEKGLVKVLNGATGIIPHDLLTKDEMNAAPFPLLPPETATHYWDPRPMGQKAPQLQVWSSRGCPFRCCFCAWPATMTGNDPDGTGRRAVRTYSADFMRGFLAAAIAAHGYQSVYDDSDTFNLVQRHTVEMCEVYRETGLPWSAMCRADTIDRDTWRLMKDSGCFGVKIGFESGSQRVIDHIVNKRLNLAEAANTSRFLRSIGLTVHGTFTVGLPGETADEVQQTIDFIQSLYRTGGLDSHQLSGTAVIEGTPLGRLRDMGPDGRLAAYDEAVVDGRFIAATDGQLKIEGMLS